MRARYGDNPDARPAEPLPGGRPEAVRAPGVDKCQLPVHQISQHMQSTQVSVRG